MKTTQEINLKEAVRVAIEYLGEKGPVPDLHDFFEQKLEELLPEENMVGSMVDYFIFGLMNAGVMGVKNELYCLLPLGTRMFTEKQEHPYAEMLEPGDHTGKEDLCRTLIKAAGMKTADVDVEHDPVRAKALIEKILGKHAGRAYLSDYDQYYPVFRVNGLGEDFPDLVFVQAEKPENDLFIAGSYFISDKENLANALMGHLVASRLKTER